MVSRRVRSTAAMLGVLAVGVPGLSACTDPKSSAGSAATSASASKSATASATATPAPSASATTSASPPVASGSSGPSSSSSSSSTPPVPPPTTKPTPAVLLKPGMKGAQVATLQKSLLALGYWLKATDGTYGHTTTQAVMALQKAAGLSRDGVAGPATFKALTASVKPTVRTRSGAVVEINKSRQLLTYAVNGVVRWVFNTSTGTGKPFINEIKHTVGIAVTPAGTFRVRRQIAAWRKADLGQLYYPKYFNGGIAIHGAYSIPAYPASHGCARVSVPAMDFIWANGIAPIGRKVVVY